LEFAAITLPKVFCRRFSVLLIQNARRRCEAMPCESRQSFPQKGLGNGSTDRWDSAGPAMIGLSS
jgi:hypothetical protein